MRIQKSLNINRLKQIWNDSHMTLRKRYLSVRIEKSYNSRLVPLNGVVPRCFAGLSKKIEAARGEGRRRDEKRE